MAENPTTIISAFGEQGLGQREQREEKPSNDKEDATNLNEPGNYLDDFPQQHRAAHENNLAWIDDYLTANVRKLKDERDALEQERNELQRQVNDLGAAASSLRIKIQDLEQKLTEFIEEHKRHHGLLEEAKRRVEGVLGENS
jgi:chromosome segregation ATPase